MSRVLRIASALMIVVVAATPLRAANEKPATDTDLLQGTWKVVAMHDGEKQLTDAEAKEMAMSLRFEGDQVFSTIGDDAPKPATYKLDTTKSPKQITVSYIKAGKPGKTYNGIYAIAGDSMTISLTSDANKPSPADFKPGERRLITKLSKVK